MGHGSGLAGIGMPRFHWEASGLRTDVIETHPYPGLCDEWCKWRLGFCEAPPYSPLALPGRLE